MSNKLSEELAQRVETLDRSGLVDVVIELRCQLESFTDGPQSRTAKIAALKKTFNRNAAAVAEAVRKVGGEVTGHAWINQTLSARVPICKLKQLSDQTNVAKLDIPHPMERDAFK